MKYDADWVINNDADEFWMFPDFDVHSYFENVPTDVDGILIDRHNAVLGHESCHGFDAHPCSTTLFEKRSFNQLGNPLPAKCLHRASDLITVAQGNPESRGIRPNNFMQKYQNSSLPFVPLVIISQKFDLGAACCATQSFQKYWSYLA